MSKKIYNLTILLLALVSVALAVLDFSKGLTPAEKTADSIIYGIFVVDYIVRFTLAEKKLLFFRSNLLDLIAIMPFNSALRIFRTLKIFRLTKAFKFLKLFRLGAFSARGLSKAKRFLNTNGFKYVLLASAMAIIISAIAMTHFEHMTFQDSLWWSFVTATTVGYGDLSPATGVGRIIASILMVVGIGLIGSLTSSITSFFLYSDKSDSTEINSEKIEMVITLYDKLSDEEKEQFNKKISSYNT